MVKRFTKTSTPSLSSLLAAAIFGMMGTLNASAFDSKKTSPSLEAKLLDNRVMLRRTSHGLVHVRASGYQGIGYGVGYAYSEDNRCLLAYRIAEVNGRLSEQLGSDAPVTSEVHDFTYS